jgi:hypothetical protein
VTGTTIAELKPRANIERETRIMTDQASWYPEIGETFAFHFSVNHSERCEQYYGKAACDHAVAPQPSSAYAPTPQSTTQQAWAEDALLLYPASEGRAL